VRTGVGVDARVELVQRGGVVRSCSGVTSRTGSGPDDSASSRGGGSVVMVVVVVMMAVAGDTGACDAGACDAGAGGTIPSVSDSNSVASAGMV